MHKAYKTINTTATIEIVEKKSRFIANTSPISSENEALDFIDYIKKKHPSARHNCFAYVVNTSPPIIRFSDDKEPSGTAGRPILDVLMGEDIKNVVVVVTRYFGGVLLGTGGLVRAYGKSAKEGILGSKIVQMDTYTLISITTDYNLSGKIQYALAEHILVNTEYLEFVKFDVYVKSIEVNDFINYIIDITNNNATILKINEAFLKVVDGKAIY